MKKTILRWLLGYNAPKYLQAREWYDNIEWDGIEDRDYTIDYYKRFNGFYISYTIWKSGSSQSNWYVSDEKSPTGTNVLTYSYETMIMTIQSILDNGIIITK